jgi:hypothetical protein
MAIIATNEGGSSFEPIEAGTYAARCVSMVHVGTIKGTFEGQEKIQNKVRLTWELPTELKIFKEENGEQPYFVSKDFTISMHEKASLRKFLEAWRGKGFTETEAKAFDITALLGKPCMLSVIHKSKDGRTYAEISSLSSLPKGMSVPEQITPTFEFSWSEFDQQKFDSLADWLKTKMKTSKEYQQRFEMESKQHAENLSTFEVEDDGTNLPF